MAIIRFASFERLDDFYAQHVRDTASKTKRKRIQTAIRRLGAHFGRPSEINDLTSAQSALQAMADKRYARSTILAMRAAFQLLALRAFQCGLLFPVPSFRCPGESPQRASVAPPKSRDLLALSVPDEHSLTCFFETTIAPRLSEHAAEKYRHSLRKMAAFAGVEANFGMLNPDFQERWLAWIHELGFKGQHHRLCLLALWRFSWRDGKHGSVPPRIRTPKIVNKPPEVYTLSVPEEQSLVDLFQRFYLPIRRLKPSTVGGWNATFQKMRAFSGVEPTFGMLTDGFTDRLSVWLLERGLTEAAVNTHLRRLLALWRFAWRKRKVEELPRDVTMLRTPKRIPECWSEDELKRLLKAAGDEQGLVGAAPANLFWTGLLSFLFVTGLRIGAVREMKRKSIDLDNGWVYVPAESQKHFADQRILLSADVLSIMRQLLQYPGVMLFQTEWGSPNVWRQRLRAILRRAGLPSGGRDLFHKLRRSCGTYIARNLGEVAAQQYLGHSSIQVTRAYIDPRKLNRPQPADVLPRITAE